MGEAQLAGPWVLPVVALALQVLVLVPPVRTADSTKRLERWCSSPVGAVVPEVPAVVVETVAAERL